MRSSNNSSSMIVPKATPQQQKAHSHPCSSVCAVASLFPVLLSARLRAWSKSGLQGEGGLMRSQKSQQHQAALTVEQQQAQHSSLMTFRAGPLPARSVRPCESCITRPWHQPWQPMCITSVPSAKHPVLRPAQCGAYTSPASRSRSETIPRINSPLRRAVAVHAPQQQQHADGWLAAAQSPARAQLTHNNAMLNVDQLGGAHRLLPRFEHLRAKSSDKAGINKLRIGPTARCRPRRAGRATRHRCEPQ